ncbi:hypothetical protein [Mameliella sp.]|uniref:hypothetical protein n=1 Tax=Mameliella sp. TaxID=1924940 RepID=UPI003B5056D3
MNYLAWALFVEGQTDKRYFETLLPRVVLNLVQQANGPEAMVPDYPVDVFGVAIRELDAAAEKICAASEAFSLLFVHGDTGSPAQEKNLPNRTCALCKKVQINCNFRRERCVIVAPRRETETWCLADKDAIRSAFGTGVDFDLSFIPDNASAVEAIGDPKAEMCQIQSSLSTGKRRRSPPIPYASLGQSQDLNRLRLLPSFQTFEAGLIEALKTLGYSGIRQP